MGADGKAESLEQIKSQMDERGESMTDTGPLVKLKEAMGKVKKEVKVNLSPSSSLLLFFSPHLSSLNACPGNGLEDRDSFSYPPAHPHAAGCQPLPLPPFILLPPLKLRAGNRRGREKQVERAGR
eukprot:762080-Hanusia_phi.AAC.3